MTIRHTRLHPSTLLLLWLAVALMLAPLSLPLLAAGAAAAMLLLARRSTALLAGALRRVRWLLLVLLAAFAWSVPGDPVWASVYAPSWQGLQQGAIHALRIVVLLCLIKWLLDFLPREGQLAGLITLLLPFRRLGLDVNTIAVRLWLALREAEAWLGRRDAGLATLWQELATEQAGEAGKDERLTLQLLPFQWLDGVVLVAAVVTVIAVWLA